MVTINVNQKKLRVPNEKLHSIELNKTDYHIRFIKYEPIELHLYRTINIYSVYDEYHLPIGDTVITIDDYIS